MQKDAIVEEVRGIRHEIERECQGNPDKLFEYFQASRKKLGLRLVRREPQHLEPLLRDESHPLLPGGNPHGSAASEPPTEPR